MVSNYELVNLQLLLLPWLKGREDDKRDLWQGTRGYTCLNGLDIIIWAAKLLSSVEFTHPTDSLRLRFGSRFYSTLSRKTIFS